MPTKPTIKNLNANSVDILNAIRADGSEHYRSAIPTAEMTSASVKEIGAILMTYPGLQNEFLTNLVNRIGRVVITSRMYTNPLAMLKKGLLEFGETVEEIFVNIAKPFQYDPAVSESTIFKREIPDVRAAFHIMNYQMYYKSTISNDQLRQAFLSMDGITDLIAKIVDAMYTGAAQDEYLTMKYMLARQLLKGQMYPVQIPDTTNANMKDIVSEFKGVSNDMEFLKTKYNYSGVYNSSKKDEQILLINAKFDARMDVEVLASAFNMTKAEFMGHRVLVDSFGELDINRLNELFANDPNYYPPTADEMAALDLIPAILVDVNYFMVFDNFYNFTEQYNGEGLYWNYWYHTWKTFSVSPFANNTVFVPGDPTITSVTVSPDALTLAKGGTAQLAAVVVNTNFAPKGVTWSSNQTDAGVSVDSNGFVTVTTTATATTATITATSIFDPTKSGTATVTISA